LRTVPCVVDRKQIRDDPLFHALHFGRCCSRFDHGIQSRVLKVVHHILDLDRHHHARATASVAIEDHIGRIGHGTERPWSAQGISGKAGILGLLFDPFSKLIVVHVGKKGADARPLKCVYVKHADEERWRRPFFS